MNDRRERFDLIMASSLDVFLWAGQGCAFRRAVLASNKLPPITVDRDTARSMQLDAGERFPAAASAQESRKKFAITFTRGVTIDPPESWLWPHAWETLRNCCVFKPSPTLTPVL
jgi:hypothetical protein